MKQGWFVLGVALVSGMTLASGIIQGKMGNRWGPTPEMIAAADKLQGIPEQFGDWRLQSTEEMDETAVNMLECVGYISRVYVNQRTRDTIRMFLVVGPAGPISVHTPEVCMPSQGYKQRGERELVSMDSEMVNHGFWALTYQVKGPYANLWRVCYAWSTGGMWSAPADARFAFAGRPYLYKIQLSSYLPAGAEASTSDPCREFLQDFVPAARPFLVAPSGE